MRTRPSISVLRPGFTIVELAAVIGIIVVLVSILLFSVGKIFRATEEVGVERQLRAIGDAIEQFHTDIGYYPPVLGFDDGGWTLGDPAPPGKLSVIPDSLPGNLALNRSRQARYGSEYTLAVYLLGAGDINGRDGDSPAVISPPNPGANDDYDDGHAGPGFRSPGPDRSWGGAVDRSLQNPTKIGRSFGPYLDPASVGKQLKLDPATGLFKILDPWGQPLRYYSGWPTVDPSSRAVSVARVPVELRSGDAVEAQILADGDAQVELDRPVLTAKFGLLSAGRPAEFLSDGSVFATFGDRKFDDDPNDAMRAPVVQDLAIDFNPGLLTKEEQDYLLERLRSNIRVVR